MEEIEKGPQLPKKKNLFLRLILLIIVAMLIYRIYNLLIIINISEANSTYNSTSAITIDEGYVKCTQKSADEEYIHENYVKNNVYVSATKSIYNGKPESNYNVVNLNDTQDDLYNAYYIYDSNIIVSYIPQEMADEYYGEGFLSNMGSYDLKSILSYNLSEKKYLSLLKEAIFYPIVRTGDYKGEKCNIISLNVYNGSFIYYYSQKTDLLVAMECYSDSVSENEKLNENGLVQVLEYEYDDKVDANLIKIPNIEDYENVEFVDGHYENENSQYPEVALSNTELQPGESLFEIVELQEGEELNPLGLKENNIVAINIDRPDTYEKFRQKYKNLRELTEKDFETYKVCIVFKEGYKLNYKQKYESKERYLMNFVFDYQPSDKDSIVLLVVPRFGNNFPNIVLSQEEAKINTEQALDVVNSNLDKIDKNFNISEEYQIFIGKDKLVKMNSELFSELEYVETSIQEQEYLAWEYCYDLQKKDNIIYNALSIYVNAITGELIGAKLELEQ